MINRPCEKVREERPALRSPGSNHRCNWSNKQHFRTLHNPYPAATHRSIFLKAEIARLALPAWQIRMSRYSLLWEWNQFQRVFEFKTWKEAFNLQSWSLGPGDPCEHVRLAKASARLQLANSVVDCFPTFFEIKKQPSLRSCRINTTGSTCATCKEKIRAPPCADDHQLNGLRAGASRTRWWNIPVLWLSRVMP